MDEASGINKIRFVRTIISRALFGLPPRSHVLSTAHPPVIFAKAGRHSVGLLEVEGRCGGATKQPGMASSRTLNSGTDAIFIDLISVQMITARPHLQTRVPFPAGRELL